ncbi:phosphotransferase [Micromonospora cathayae]|uniref:Phosphotransferase n=1 Tax=Micromonospora cathayae TaxID=3028804 RepID=A0ABY7ZSW3_9ACTN|nr:phosphotransferase [Micromonospora sp. HUAS 3]WDZ85891.1 phosphotransferase [Micromonospora sp. HUAS 3]
MTTSPPPTAAGQPTVDTVADAGPGHPVADAAPGRCAVSDQSWTGQARDWLTDELARHGRRVTGPVEPRVRPWSTVWRVPTDGGTYWFKANSADTAYEAGLVRALARIAPGRVPDPVAGDTRRGWTLLPDGGETLRDVLDRQRDPMLWERILPVYAELQLATVDRVDELLTLGVPDHRPAALPEQFAGLLDDREWLLFDQPDGLTPDAYDRLRGLLPEFTDRCRRLDELAVPAALQHDDLHDGNVFAGADGCRIFDWGDASVSHPFGTLLVTLRSVAYGFDLPVGDPALARLRDAYLEPWSARHDRPTLLESLDLAFHLAKVTRALSWRRALRTAEPADRQEYAAAVPGWLGELFTPNPL